MDNLKAKLKNIQILAARTKSPTIDNEFDAICRRLSVSKRKELHYVLNDSFKDLEYQMVYNFQPEEDADKEACQDLLEAISKFRTFR